MGPNKKIHSFTKEIYGLTKPFEFVIYVNKKDWYFACDVPEKRYERSKSGIVGQNYTEIIGTETLYAQSYKELEKKINVAIEIFENLSNEYETVIMYYAEDSWSYRDGSGKGFIFNYCVCKKVRVKKTDEIKYFVIKDNATETSYTLNLKAHGEETWKELPHTEETMDFLRKIDKNISNIAELLKSITPETVNNLIAINPPESPLLKKE